MLSIESRVKVAKIVREINSLSPDEQKWFADLGVMMMQKGPVHVKKVVDDILTG